MRPCCSEASSEYSMQMSPICHPETVLTILRGRAADSIAGMAGEGGRVIDGEGDVGGTPPTVSEVAP